MTVKRVQKVLISLVKNVSRWQISPSTWWKFIEVIKKKAKRLWLRDQMPCGEWKISNSWTSDFKAHRECFFLPPWLPRKREKSEKIIYELSKLASWISSLYFYSLLLCGKQNNVCWWVFILNSFPFLSSTTISIFSRRTHKKRNESRENNWNFYRQRQTFGSFFPLLFHFMLPCFMCFFFRRKLFFIYYSTAQIEVSSTVITMKNAPNLNFLFIFIA